MPRWRKNSIFGDGPRRAARSQRPCPLPVPGGRTGRLAGGNGSKIAAAWCVVLTPLALRAGQQCLRVPHASLRSAACATVQTPIMGRHQPDRSVSPTIALSWNCDLRSRWRERGPPCSWYRRYTDRSWAGTKSRGGMRPTAAISVVSCLTLRRVSYCGNWPIRQKSTVHFQQS
jgi:hypothetical protein